MKHLYTVILIIITTLNTYSQTLSSISTEATSSTTSNSFVDVTGAYVTLDVTGADKIFLIATFSSKTNSGNAVAEYRIADNSDNNINSSGMAMNHNGNSYIGSDIYIFDVSLASGNKTYVFQHQTSAQTLETTVSLSAILLYDGTNQLNNDFTTFTNSLALGDTWESILESNEVVLIDNSFGGGFYVSAMVETQKTSGGANNVVGEWKLQYKENTATTWTDLNSPVSRSATWTGVGIVNLVGAMPDNTPRGTYKFRIVHRKVSGASHVQSITRKLSVVSMATVGGFFPIFISSRPTSSTTNTSMNPIISNLVEPQDNTNMFFHAQYSLQSSGTSNAPMHDLFVSTSGGTLLDGSDYARYIQNNSDVGNGGITTALNNLIAGITYKIELRHKSTASRSLTTNNAFLVGFGMFKTAQSLILPVTVNSTQGFISGSYSNLKEAFDAINNGVYRGEIVIYINSDIEETATASINASGVGSANYTDILIFPTSSSLSISGNLNAPIIDLNGADNITIDGRVNAIGTDPSLTIINTNTGTSASTIRFINSAENNTVKCSYIEGAN